MLTGTALTPRCSLVSLAKDQSGRVRNIYVDLFKILYYHAMGGATPRQMILPSGSILTSCVLKF